MKQMMVKNQKSLMDLKLGSRLASWRRHNSQQAENKDDDVLLESRNEKGVIIFNRPEVLNVGGFSLVDKTLKYIKECQKSNKSMIIVKGQGDKVFCAGGDLGLVRQLVISGSNNHLHIFRTSYTICAIVHHMKIPVIALLNGVAMGGGLAMAVLGRYRVATENTLCAMPETSIGSYPDSGAAYFLPRFRKSSQSGSKLGLYLGLTGHRLRGSDNLKAGLATHMCSQLNLTDLQEDLISLDNSKASNPREIEKILQHYTDLCPDSKKTFSLEGNLAQIDKIFSGNSVEEIISNLENDASDWSKSVLKTLGRMSPTSLKITFKHFEKCQQLNLKECLALDYVLFQRSVQGRDFIEGVRAILIDKDQRPKWNPSSLKDVSESYINSFFEPLPKDQENLKLDDC